MNENYLLEKPIWQMSGREFLEFIRPYRKDVHKSECEEQVSNKDKGHVDDMTGIAKIFGCCMSYANCIKGGSRIGICPNISITVTASDLKEVFMEFHEELYKKMCAEKEKVETYLTQKQAMEMLGCSQPTLWRWNKAGYLLSIKIGAKARYRMSDIKKIMEGRS